MSNELWGVTGGRRQRVIDDVALAQAAQGLQKGQQDLETGVVKLQASELALNQQKKLISFYEAMQGKADTQGDTPGATGEHYEMADSLDSMALATMAAGEPDKAALIATRASSIRANNALISERENTRKVKELSELSNMMNSVTDEHSWQEANQLWSQQHGGRQSPYAKLPYNPEVIKFLQSSTTSAKDQAAIEAAHARTRASDASASERKAREPLIEAQTAVAIERAKVLKKQGGGASEPKPSDVKMITDLMNVDYPVTKVETAEARVKAQAVAAHMLQLIDTEHLSRREAASRAYQIAKAGGDFGGFDIARIRAGRSSAKPLDIPAGALKDTTLFKPNKYYRGNGVYADQVFLWNGSTLVPVGKVKDFSGKGDDDADAEEEEE